MSIKWAAHMLSVITEKYFNTGKERQFGGEGRELRLASVNLAFPAYTKTHKHRTTPPPTVSTHMLSAPDILLPKLKSACREGRMMYTGTCSIACCSASLDLALQRLSNTPTLSLSLYAMITVANKIYSSLTLYVHA